MAAMDLLGRRWALRILWELQAHGIRTGPVSTQVDPPPADHAARP